MRRVSSGDDLFGATPLKYGAGWSTCISKNRGKRQYLGGHQGAQAVGELADAAERPAGRYSVEEGGGEGIARADGIDHRDAVAGQLFVLAVEENGAALVLRG